SSMQRSLWAKDEDSRRRGSGQNFSIELVAKNVAIAVLTLLPRSAPEWRTCLGAKSARLCIALTRACEGCGPAPDGARWQGRAVRGFPRADCLAGFGSAGR